MEPTFILPADAPSTCATHFFKWWALYAEAFGLDGIGTVHLTTDSENPANVHPTYGKPLFSMTGDGLTEWFYWAPDHRDSFHNYLSSEALPIS